MTHVTASRIKQWLTKEPGLLFILLALLVFFTVLSDFFFQPRNLLNISRQISINLIVAIGMTLVIIAGEIDLSVGSVAALAGVVAAMVIKATGSVTIGILSGLLLGLITGLFTGLMTVYGRIQSFITTLAMFGIARGLALVLTDGRPVSGLPVEFGVYGAGYMGSIPVSSLIAATIFCLALLFLNRTEHGFNLRAIGAERETVRLSGIRVNRYRIAGFMISGFMCGIGGILITSLLLSAQPTAAMGLELSVIAIVILGGASLTGGIGTLWGTLLGAIIIGVIDNGMNLVGISPFFQQIVKGSIILVAVLFKGNQ